MMMISIIIPVGKNEPQIARLVDSIHKTIGSTEYEIIVVALDPEIYKSIASQVDICLVGPWNCAEARNLGAKMAKGDIFVFSDAHTEFLLEYSTGWGEIIESTFKSRNNIGVATFPRYTLTGDINRSTRHLNMIAKGLKFNSDMNLLDVKYIEPINSEIPFIWGDFMAIRRKVFEELNGFITEAWGHMEDRCLCISCTLFSYKNICIAEGVMIGAYIRGAEWNSYPSFPFWWTGNMLCHILHYTGGRLDRAKQFWIQDGHSPKEFEIVYNRWSYLRDYYLKRRKYSDSWYFDTFLKQF